MKDYKNIVTTHTGTYGVISSNLRKKSSKSLLLNFKKNVILEDPELRSIQLIINKKYRDRHFQETTDLNNFLLKTKIAAEFKNDIITENIPIDVILYHLTQFIEEKSYKTKDFIYLSGDKCDNIYLILKGEISLNRIETEQVSLTMEQYYNYLKEELKQKTDHMLIMNIIDTNSHIFPLRRQTDLNDMDNIVMLIKLTIATNELSVPTIESIKSIYKEYNKDFGLYSFDLVIKGDKDMKRFHIEIVEMITERERYYSYLMQRSNYSAVPIMKMYYFNIRAVKPLSYFGNYKLWNLESNIRSETARCESDACIICINKKQYGTFIQNEQRQVKEKEMEKVHQLYFFRYISKLRFNRDIYLGFDLKEYFRGQILFDSDVKLDCFYIIKEGSVDLTLQNTSLLELDSLLESMKKWERKLRQSRLQIKSQFEAEEEYIINHPYSLVQRHLNKKRTYKVFGASIKQMFGDWELYYNKKKSPFTVTVTSEKAIVYSYKYINFENETEDKVLLMEGLKQQAYSKLVFLLERLRTIRYSYYKKIDTEIQRKLKEEELIMPQNTSEALSLQSTSIKVANNKINKRIKGNNSDNAIDINKTVYHKKDKSSDMGNSSSSNTNNNTINKDNSKEQQYGQIQGEEKEVFNDLKLITAIHSYKRDRGDQPKYFLPPIHLNLSEDKRRRIQKLKQNSKEVITAELSNTYFEKDKMRVMMPLSTVQNVPLINKLKYACIKEEAFKSNAILNDTKNIDSLSKSISKRNCSKEQKVKQSLQNIPGAYYMAVQQLMTK